MIKILVTGIAIALLTACTPSGGGQTTAPGPAPSNSGYQSVPISGAVATPQERAACAAVGGTIRPAGLLGYESCVQAYADAGTPCSDSSQCIGQCLNSAELVDFGTPVSTGQCEATDSGFGCMQEIVGGVADAALCVD